MAETHLPSVVEQLCHSSSRRRASFLLSSRATTRKFGTTWKGCSSRTTDHGPRTPVSVTSYSTMMRATEDTTDVNGTRTWNVCSPEASGQRTAYG